VPSALGESLAAPGGVSEGRRGIGSVGDVGKRVCGEGGTDHDVGCVCVRALASEGMREGETECVSVWLCVCTCVRVQHVSRTLRAKEENVDVLPRPLTLAVAVSGVAHLSQRCVCLCARARVCA